MKTVLRGILALILVGQFCTGLWAQSAGSATGAATDAVVPQLVNYAGRAVDQNGKAVTGIAGITFSIYQDQNGGSPLWTETQNVQPDSRGNYTVQLGATKSTGLPLSLFTSGDARWLGVRVDGTEEQPRVLLLSVPYALKAADAQTLGGLPASAFVLAAPPASGAGSSSSLPANQSSSPTVGGTGTQNYIPLWTDSSGDLGNSALYQLGTGASAKIGINETNPLLTLDVNGSELVRGLFEMATTGYATPTKAYTSQPLNIESSAYNSSTKKYALNHFQWQAEPTGNNTATPGATLNLLYGTDPAAPTETGLSLNNKGIFTFAPGQTFPGSGSISGVTAGTDLTGGGTSGNVTLNLDVTKVPQLASANVFTQTLSVNATNPFTGVLNATSPYQAIVGTMTSNDFFTAAITGNASATGTGTTMGVVGESSTSAGMGVYGQSFGTGYGVYGTSSGTGVYGVTSDQTDYGFYGVAGINGGQPLPPGYFFVPPTGIGVYGQGTDGGMFVGSASGVLGLGQPATSSTDPGVGGEFNAGDASLTSDPGTYGILVTGSPTQGSNDAGDGAWIMGGASTGGYQGNGIVSFGDTYNGGVNNQYGAPFGYAAAFFDDVFVDGKINYGQGVNMIDHPLDPANKYLAHASMGSPDMKNFYDGVATLDGNGEAYVELPDWFESVNRDFRYQLTSIGTPGPNLYIAEEIAGNHFRIAGGKAGSKVSWQVTGIRQDAWANAHRVSVEQEKPARLRGFYLHPELHGAAKERGIEWALHPKQMQQLKARREKLMASKKP